MKVPTAITVHDRVLDDLVEADLFRFTNQKDEMTRDVCIVLAITPTSLGRALILHNLTTSTTFLRNTYIDVRVGVELLTLTRIDAILRP